MRGAGCRVICNTANCNWAKRRRSSQQSCCPSGRRKNSCVCSAYQRTMSQSITDTYTDMHKHMHRGTQLSKCNSRHFSLSLALYLNCNYSNTCQTSNHLLSTVTVTAALYQPHPPATPHTTAVRLHCCPTCKPLNMQAKGVAESGREKKGAAAQVTWLRLALALASALTLAHASGRAARQAKLSCTCERNV